MNKQKIEALILSVYDIYEGQEELNTIWEIFCDTYNFDYEDEKAGKIFDELVENGEIKDTRMI